MLPLNDLNKMNMPMSDRDDKALKFTQSPPSLYIGSKSKTVRNGPGANQAGICSLEPVRIAYTWQGGLVLFPRMTMMFSGR